MESALPMLGWLIFAWGAGIVAIAIFSSHARVRSPTRRFADVLSGLFFCALALTLILASATSKTRLGFAIAAGIIGLASWGLGLRARQVDRATGSRKPH